MGAMGAVVGGYSAVGAPGTPSPTCATGSMATTCPMGGAKTVFSMPQLVHVSDEDEAEAFSETVWTCVGFTQINHLFVRFAGRGDYGAIRLARK